MKAKDKRHLLRLIEEEEMIKNAPVPYWASIEDKDLRDKAIIAYHPQNKLKEVLVSEEDISVSFPRGKNII